MTILSLTLFSCATTQDGPRLYWEAVNKQGMTIEKMKMDDTRCQQLAKSINYWKSRPLYHQCMIQSGYIMVELDEKS